MTKPSRNEIWLTGPAWACDVCGKVYADNGVAVDCCGRGAVNLAGVDTPKGFYLAFRAARAEHATAEARRRADRLWGGK